MLQRTAYRVWAGRGTARVVAFIQSHQVGSEFTTRQLATACKMTVFQVWSALKPLVEAGAILKREPLTGRNVLWSLGTTPIEFVHTKPKTVGPAGRQLVQDHVNLHALRFQAVPDFNPQPSIDEAVAMAATVRDRMEAAGRFKSTEVALALQYELRAIHTAAERAKANMAMMLELLA